MGVFDEDNIMWNPIKFKELYKFMNIHASCFTNIVGTVG